MRNMPSYEATQRCKLGCQLCEDSIEHYSCCRNFLEFLLLPPSPWFGNCFQAQIKGNIFHDELRFMRERCSEIGSCNPCCSDFFLVGASPVEPSNNLNMNKVLMLLVKQAAAGFIMFHRFQGNFPAFLVWHWHAYPFTTWNLCLQHQEVNATPEVQALVARLNDLKSGGAAGLGALGGTTPRGCSFTIDCHQVSLSKWVSAIMRWTKVNTMPQTIPNTGLLLGLPWFTMVYRLTPLTSAL